MIACCLVCDFAADGDLREGECVCVKGERGKGRGKILINKVERLI